MLRVNRLKIKPTIVKSRIRLYCLPSEKVPEIKSTPSFSFKKFISSEGKTGLSKYAAIFVEANIFTIKLISTVTIIFGLSVLTFILINVCPLFTIYLFCIIMYIIGK